jgi:surface antigen
MRDRAASFRVVLRLFAVLAACAVSACASGTRSISAGGPAGLSYPGITCAPFARELSGIALYGDAATWWDGAAGRYNRSSRPVLGAALVFRREQRLASGHVSVVSRILGPRQIQVTQANWVAGELDEDQLVVDVSERNDWTEVRVWWPPVGQLGSHPYPTYGFIEPPMPATREQITRATRIAANLALTSGVGRPLPRARQMAGGG